MPHAQSIQSTFSLDHRVPFARASWHGGQAVKAIRQRTQAIILELARDLWRCFILLIVIQVCYVDIAELCGEAHAAAWSMTVATFDVALDVYISAVPPSQDSSLLPGQLAHNPEIKHFPGQVFVHSLCPNPSFSSARSKIPPR